MTRAAILLGDALDIVQSVVPGPEAGASEPPTEFRIFTANTVHTVRGDLIFDAESAKAIMSHAAEWGNDFMIDWDHQSVLKDSPISARKAAGWFKPEVRNGELWATNVRWTPAAKAALSAGEWRYISPALDHKDRRITNLVNVGLVNIPATKRMTPLVASAIAEHERDTPMDSLRVLLGLADTAGESELLTAVSRAREFEREVLSATGQASTSHALATLAGWKESAAMAEKLSARVSELETKATTNQVGLLLDKAISEMRVSPGEREYLASHFRDPSALSSYLSARAPMPHAKTHVPDPAHAPANTLSDHERSILSVTGVSEDKYLAARAATSARGG